MCDLHKEFILCTCEEKSFKGKNHWLLYRYDATRPHLMGLTMPALDHSYFNSLSDFILHQLNSKNCFDKKIKLENGDVLVIVIRNPEKRNVLSHFAFSYNRKKWEKDDYEMMELSHMYVQQQRGLIENKE